MLRQHPALVPLVFYSSAPDGVWVTAVSPSVGAIGFKWMQQEIHPGGGAKLNCGADQSSTYPRLLPLLLNAIIFSLHLLDFIFTIPNGLSYITRFTVDL